MTAKHIITEPDRYNMIINMLVANNAKSLSERIMVLDGDVYEVKPDRIVVYDYMEYAAAA